MENEMNNNSKASESLLEELHGTVAKQLLTRIQSGEATAAEFAQAIKMLKDNGIDSEPTKSSPLGQLGSSLDNLPFTDSDDVTAH